MLVPLLCYQVTGPGLHSFPHRSAWVSHLSHQLFRNRLLAALQVATGTEGEARSVTGEEMQRGKS